MSEEAITSAVRLCLPAKVKVSEPVPLLLRQPTIFLLPIVPLLVFAAVVELVVVWVAFVPIAPEAWSVVVLLVDGVVDWVLGMLEGLAD